MSLHIKSCLLFLCTVCSHQCCVVIMACVRILLLRWSPASKISAQLCWKTRLVRFVFIFLYSCLSSMLWWCWVCDIWSVIHLLQQKVTFSEPYITWTKSRKQEDVQLSLWMSQLCGIVWNSRAACWWWLFQGHGNFSTVIIHSMFMSYISDGTNVCGSRGG